MYSKKCNSFDVSKGDVIIQYGRHVKMYCNLARLLSYIDYQGWEISLSGSRLPDLEDDKKKEGNYFRDRARDHKLRKTKEMAAEYAQVWLRDRRKVGINNFRLPNSVNSDGYFLYKYFNYFRKFIFSFFSIRRVPCPLCWIFSLALMWLFLQFLKFI